MLRLDSITSTACFVPHVLSRRQVLSRIPLSKAVTMALPYMRCTVRAAQQSAEAAPGPPRHIDGTWRSADEVPRTAEGRPEAFVAINGHGSYPHPGRIIRLFGAFNDHTSRRGEEHHSRSTIAACPARRKLLPAQFCAAIDVVALSAMLYLERLLGTQGVNASYIRSAALSSSRHSCATGAVWAPQSCVLVTPGGKLPSVESRGDDLNGTAYPSVEAADALRNGNGSGCSSFDAEDSSSSGNGNGSNSSKGSGGSSSSSMDVVAAGSPIAAARNVTLRHDPGPDWLYYGGKWGSTVQVPMRHPFRPL